MERLAPTGAGLLQSAILKPVRSVSVLVKWCIFPRIKFPLLKNFMTIVKIGPAKELATDRITNRTLEI